MSKKKPKTTQWFSVTHLWQRSKPFHVVIGVIIGAFLKPAADQVVKIFFEKNDDVSIEYAVLTYEKQTPNIPIGQLTLADTKEPVHQNFIQVLVRNRGADVSEFLKVSLRPLVHSKIESWSLDQDPDGLPYNMPKRATRDDPLTVTWPTFPRNAQATLGVALSTFPIHRANILISAFDKKNSWPVREASISLRKRVGGSLAGMFDWFRIPGIGIANAAQVESSSTKKLGGVFFGDYSPIAISNNIFVLFQEKGVLNSREAAAVMNEIRKPSPGVSIGGVNILKTDETLLNVLIQKDEITLEDAKAMVARSREGGGIKINGINVIRLKAEILNSMVQRKIVTVQEAQHALDSAKRPAKTAD